MRAIVRFALANPEKIAAMLEEEKKLKIANWLSKEGLTAILELDLEEVEDLAAADYVAHIDIGGRLGASAGTVSSKLTAGTQSSSQLQDSATAKESTSSAKTNAVEN